MLVSGKVRHPRSSEPDALVSTPPGISPYIHPTCGIPVSALVEGIRQSKALTFLVDSKELLLVVMSTHHLDHFLRPRLGVDDNRIGPPNADARFGVILPMPVLGPENAVHHAR